MGRACYGCTVHSARHVFTHTHITRRALLADEMGLGKTVQAIAAAAAYVADWPLLVACPAAARLHWREELLRWLTLTLTLTPKPQNPKTPSYWNLNINIINGLH